MIKKINYLLIILLFLLTTPTFAHIFSDTHVEFHMDFGKTDQNYGGLPSAGIFTMTLEHYSTFAYGDNYFFIDLCSGRNFHFNTDDGSLYMEYAPRFSINKIAGIEKLNDIIPNVYFTPQINYGYATARWAEGDDGREHFSIGPIFLFGVSFDINVPFFQVFSVHFLWRYEFRTGRDPIDGTRMPDDSGFQFTWVWQAKLFKLFEIKKQVEEGKEPVVSKAGDFIFKGFLDFWDRGAITNDRPTVITEPQFLIYLTDSLALGTEIEISYNFAGASTGTRHIEVDPTIFLRWDF